MKKWLRAALVRAIRTIAQTVLAFIGTGATGILDVNWTGALSAAALAGVISILTSIIFGIPEVDEDEEDEDWDDEEDDE